MEPPRLAPPRLPRLPPGLGPEYRIDGSCCLGTNLVFNGEVLDKPQWAGRKDARVANQLRSAGAGMKSSPRALGHARKTGHVLATFVVEATALYRLGGFLGILLARISHQFAVKTCRQECRHGTLRACATVACEQTVDDRRGANTRVCRIDTRVDARPMRNWG